MQISTGAPASLKEDYTYKFGLPVQIDLSGKDYLNVSIPIGSRQGSTVVRR